MIEDDQLLSASVVSPSAVGASIPMAAGLY
jgi:hypothetical protein